MSKKGLTNFKNQLKKFEKHISSADYGMPLFVNQMFYLFSKVFKMTTILITVVDRAWMFSIHFNVSAIMILIVEMILLFNWVKLDKESDRSNL